MKRKVLFMMVVLSVCLTSLNASTVAYWRFEEGPVGAQVPKPAPTGFNWYPSVPDSSGNGNELTVWDESGAGYVFRDDVAYSTVLPTNVTNNYSVKNSGGGPAMWTDAADTISSITPAAFTIEATFKLENGGNKTIVGRDSFGTNENAALAALYLQVVGNNALAIKFCDVEGYWHEAVSADNAYVGFNWSPEMPDGDGTAPWYSIAAVSDGSMLSLYLIEHGAGTGWQQIASTDMTTSGSTNTALTAGADNPNGSGDWDPGCWTVGRGLYDGRHVDRAYGFIDEVRISDSALTTADFLVPEPATLALLGLGMLVLRRKK